MRSFWRFVHNAVAHPLMALSFGARWSDRFHDWTYEQGWPEA